MTLLELPIDVLEGVFKCLDHKALLAMREVTYTLESVQKLFSLFQMCKITKELAEATTLNRTDTISIDRLKMVQEVCLLGH